jgi:hypothetical protein
MQITFLHLTCIDHVEQIKSIRIPQSIIHVEKEELSSPEPPGRRSRAAGPSVERRSQFAIRRNTPSAQLRMGASLQSTQDNMPE